MSAHSFSGRGQMFALFFQKGAIVLHLVLGRRKCPGGGTNVRDGGANVLHSLNSNPSFFLSCVILLP